MIPAAHLLGWMMKMTLYLWFTYVWHSGYGRASGLSVCSPVACGQRRAGGGGAAAACQARKPVARPGAEQGKATSPTH